MTRKTWHLTPDFWQITSDIWHAIFCVCIGATILTRQDFKCLRYAVFLSSILLLNKNYLIRRREGGSVDIEHTRTGTLRLCDRAGAIVWSGNSETLRWMISTHFGWLWISQNSNLLLAQGLSMGKAAIYGRNQCIYWIPWHILGQLFKYSEKWVNRSDALADC